VGELQAEFRWLDESDRISGEKLQKITDEIADIGIFLLRLASILNIDLNESVKQKLKLNSKRLFEGPDFKKLN
jgi:NTP pyrophosphatase (non-canonical NTP hydrolase)